MSAIPPSSPSRRHFIGIAAATARKLSMISVGSSALSLLGGRDAAAGVHEQHHHWTHSGRHREFGDVGQGGGSGFGQASGSGGGVGQARGYKSRSGTGSGSGASGQGSGGSAGAGSSATGSGSGRYGSGSGSTSGNGSGSGSASGSGASGSGTGSGTGSGYGTGSAGTGSDAGYGSGSGSYGSASGYGSGGVRCFARGTHILTTSGEVAVEDLAIGDEIVTLNGPKPVKWIGRQVLQRNPSAAWHPRVLPVRISRFAIDDHTPQQDVLLSQHHCLFIDGALIPARHLVNGSSICFDEATLTLEMVEYFHVELDTHEVIYASGLPVESYRYGGGAVNWDNIDEYLQRYGEHRIMSPFAPVHSYEGGFDELRGLIRLAASQLIDVRDPIQIAHDRLKARASRLAA